MDIEGRLPSVATDINANIIHVDAGIGRMNVAAKSKPGYNGSNSKNIATGLVDNYHGVKEAILMTVVEETSARIDYTLSL
ncbi:hypothetical protein Tco_0828767 [Tanacetum coccineum]